MIIAGTTTVTAIIATTATTTTTTNYLRREPPPNLFPPEDGRGLPNLCPEGVGPAGFPNLFPWLLAEAGTFPIRGAAGLAAEGREAKAEFLNPPDCTYRLLA